MAERFAAADPAAYFVGDAGTELGITFVDGVGQPVDISTATTLEIAFRKPDGAVLTKAATLASDGTDGRMHYVVEPSFFDVAGTWYRQGHVVTPVGEWWSQIVPFTVFRRVDQ